VNILKMGKIKISKIVIIVLVAILGIMASYEFLELRFYREDIVVSDSFTEEKMLSDWLPSIKNTAVDAPVYVFDSGVPGGSVLICGGIHPYEPATTLAAYVIMNNINVEKGKVFIIPRTNMSAATLGMLGNAYPKFFTIETEWGEKKIRIGDRATNPLHQWPDPFVYVNYPSGQNLAYTDIRNMNRTFPGKEDGSLTERGSYALMELTRKENIDLYIDLHEASLMYPVVSTYVAHQDAQDIAMMASMVLSASEFPMKCEVSPSNLHGLTHREVGDYSDAYAVLMETPEPFIDRVAGRMTEELMTDGIDEFIQTAAENDLIYCNYDINEGITMPGGYVVKGAPMDYRVGRHLSATREVITWMGQFDPAKEVIVTFPGFIDVMDNGSGFYLSDPKEADEFKVFKN